MNFQYISDLHLEVWHKIPNIERSAPYLVLAGDIGDPSSKIYKMFIEYVSSIFDHVFLIAGNHEYYNYECSDNLEYLKDVDDLIRSNVSTYSNVHFLQNEIYHLTDDIIIFGSTYWTHIEDDQKDLVRNKMHDYEYMNNFTTEKCNQLHDLAIKKLEQYYLEYTNKRWLLVFHHLPKLELVLPKYKNINYISGFASTNYPKILDDNNVLAIIYGHTHTPSIQGKYYTNPIGYPSENMLNDYNKILKL